MQAKIAPHSRSRNLYLMFRTYKWRNGIYFKVRHIVFSVIGHGLEKKVVCIYLLQLLPMIPTLEFSLTKRIRILSGVWRKWQSPDSSYSDSDLLLILTPFKDFHCVTSCLRLRSRLRFRFRRKWKPTLFKVATALTLRTNLTVLCHTNHSHKGAWICHTFPDEPSSWLLPRR